MDLEDGPLRVRDLQPLAALDNTPEDLQLACEDLAGDPVWTAEITPFRGDSLMYKPGALGGKDISHLRAEAAQDAVPPAAVSANRRGGDLVAAENYVGGSSGWRAEGRHYFGAGVGVPTVGVQQGAVIPAEQGLLFVGSQRGL